jgi:hypothetical protein
MVERDCEYTESTRSPENLEYLQLFAMVLSSRIKTYAQWTHGLFLTGGYKK